MLLLPLPVRPTIPSEVPGARCRSMPCSTGLGGAVAEGHRVEVDGERPGRKVAARAVSDRGSVASSRAARRVPAAAFWNSESCSATCQSGSLTCWEKRNRARTVPRVISA